MSIGVVIIGRNEGARLIGCVESVLECCPVNSVVYVDSGSTDASPQTVRSRGVRTIELDARTAFSAARARNAGFAALQQAHQDLEFIQFIDGDCRLQPGWLHAAERFFQTHPDSAVVCGRRREQFRGASIYNRLCDMEWNTPLGAVQVCGGDAMICAEAFASVEGFDPMLIAGEEPELCLRLRGNGWRIHRIDAEMTLHDADMHRFSQWWRRSQRAGFAFAAGAWKQGAGSRRHWVRQVVRTWVWSVLVPALALLPAWATGGLSLLVLLAWVWPLSGAVRDRLFRGDTFADANAYGLFCLVGKWAELVGQLKFISQVWGPSRGIIEYKQPPAAITALNTASNQ
jgi:GT2 family glycosyltransferase